MRQFGLQLCTNVLACGLDQQRKGKRRDVLSLADALGKAVVSFGAFDEALHARF